MRVLTHPIAPVTISRSKVERPLVYGQWVRRPQIEARLDHTLTRSLTAIIAPAGHGKTGTIVAWLGLRELDAAWVTLDSRDAELTRFAAHVAVALDQVVPGLVSDLFALLTVPDRLAPRDLGERFAEALYDLERDVVLVLDDVHAADAGAIAPFLAGLLYAAPRRLHTIVSSRANSPFPLSRLRTMGDVEELTGADLRFSPHETGELLRLETGKAVDPALAARVRASVGGWPAAIRLIAMSGATTEGHQPRETGGERQQDLLLDYLGDEILTQLPAPHRDLLLRVSLVERFNAPILEALAAMQGGRLGRPDLERLRSLELYREIPGLSETWFAYHPVFRDALRHEVERTMDAEAIAELHRSIAQWFAEAGLTRDALQHLVAAGDVSAAATLIESRVTEAFAREEWQSVASWLRSIPLEEIRRRPELLLASAWVSHLSGRDARTAEVLETVRDPRIRNRVTDAQRAELNLLAEWPDGDPVAGITIAEDAIARIPSSRRYRYGYAHMVLGMALTSAGREDEALARLAAFTERESVRIDAASIRGYFGRVAVLWQTGRLARCEQAAADQLQLAQTHALPLSAGWAAAFLGFIAYERGELAQATRHFKTVVAGAEQFHFLCVRDAFFAQILTYLAQGLHDEADRAIARVREFAMAAEAPHQLELVDSFVARAALIRGDLATAQRWLETSSPALGQDDLKSVEHPLLTRVKVLIAVGAHDALGEADHLLTAFVHEARATHMALALLEGQAVQALLHEARGDRVAATGALRASLEMAAVEGIVQRYAYLGPALAAILRRLLAERDPVHHARSALDALESVLAAQPALSLVGETLPTGFPETPLTDRELQVLGGLARRLTNSEIGQELFISPLTVKHHVEHITGKLAVSGRRDAVQRARELGLIA